MVAASLTFLAGRYHATPWGRHVNEGAAEWPPSPYRLLRALIAVWHHKGAGRWSEAEVCDLIHKLSEHEPVFQLPPANAGHTRHYMPTDRKPTLVFDAFVSVAKDQPLIVVWPGLELSDRQQATLSGLLRGLNYLGRSESWVEADLLPEWAKPPNCEPAEAVADGLEAQRVLMPKSAGEYESWRAGFLEAERLRCLEEKREKARAKGKDPSAVKLTKADEQRLGALLPERLFDMLQIDTADLRAAGWSQPPAGRWLTYGRDPRALRHFRPRRLERRGAEHAITVARLGLHSTVLPPLAETLRLGEKVRRALLSRADGAPPVFLGRGADGRPLEGHEHAFIIPCDDDNDGRLDHVLVCAAGGLDPEAIKAVGTLRALSQENGRPDLKVVLLGLGSAETFGGLDALGARTAALAEARTWVSRTPFILTRHPKMYRDGRPKLREDGRWIDGPEDQLLRELELRGYPEVVRLESTNATLARGRPVRWLRFVRHRRQGRGAQFNSMPFGFRIEFAQPVRGPLCLGYGAHYGLGLFVAEGG